MSNGHGGVVSTTGTGSLTPRPDRPRFGNWFGLKADSCLTVGEGFKTIFWWWAVRGNIAIILVLIAFAIVMGIWGESFWLGLLVFGMGILSQAASNYAGWILIPALANQGRYFHESESQYATIRSRRGEILNAYSGRFVLYGKVTWNGCLYYGDEPYVFSQDLSQDKGDPRFISLKDWYLEIKGGDSSRDGYVDWLLWIEFSVDTDQLLDLVLKRSAIWTESINGLIHEKIQDMISSMASFDARFLKDRDKILAIDPENPPERPFPKDASGNDDGMPPTDWREVRDAAEKLDKLLNESNKINVERWGISEARDAKLEDVFSRRTRAAQDVPAALLEKQATKAREEGKIEPFEKAFGKDARAFAIYHGSEGSFTDIRIDPEVGMVAGNIANAIGGNNRGGGQGGNRGGGNQRNQGGQGGQRRPRRGRRNR